MVYKLSNAALILSMFFGVAACNPETPKAETRPQKIEIAKPLPAPILSAKQAKPVDIKRMGEAQTVHIIEIHKMKFTAKFLKVKLGDQVTWINKDVVPHTATASDKSWDSGHLKKGESYTLTITNQTELDYFCLYHRQMTASLVRINAQ